MKISFYFNLKVSFVMTKKQTNKQNDRQTYKFQNKFRRGGKTSKMSHLCRVAIRALRDSKGKDNL